MEDIPKSNSAELVSLDIQQDTQPFKTESKGYLELEKQDYIKYLSNSAPTMTLISIIQILIAYFLQTRSNSTLNTVTMIQSFTSLTLCLRAIYWTRFRQTVKEVASSDRPKTLKETIEDYITLAFFMTCMVLPIVKFSLIMNFWVQKDGIAYQLQALYSDPALWESTIGFPQSLNHQIWLCKSLIVAYCFLDFFIILYCLLSARGIFLHIKEQDQCMSYLSFFANLSVFVLSICAIFAFTYILKLFQFPKIAQYISHGSVIAIFILLYVIIILSIVFWVLINGRHRMAMFAFSTIILVLSYFLITGSGQIFRQIKDVKSYYIENWVERMSLVHESELINYGCPYKYMPNKHKCPKDEKGELWEMNSIKKKCLNEGCKGILAEIYTSSLYIGANQMALIACFLGLLSIGYYYFHYCATPTTKIQMETDALNIVFLVAQVVLGLGVAFYYWLGNKPLINEFEFTYHV